jgi:hypothetical protein
MWSTVVEAPRTDRLTRQRRAKVLATVATPRSVTEALRVAVALPPLHEPEKGRMLIASGEHWKTHAHDRGGSSQNAFAKYLVERGWEVKTDNDDHTDVIAWRGDELLVAEVKGTTTSPGLDVDTAYGQLLRRMRERPDTVRYALVVPDSARRSALRVSDEVRGRLGIDVWTVDEAGSVQLVE